MANVEIGKLCYYEEGPVWVAYWSPSQDDTEEESVVLGTIMTKFVQQSEERKQAFMDLMQACFGDVIEGVYGTRPTLSLTRGGVIG